MTSRLTSLALATVLAANLSACFPLVAGGVAASALVVTDRRTSGTYVEDQGIELKILKQLSERFPGSHVTATSYNRSLLLTGEAVSEQQKEDIELMARGIPNVQRIYNYLTVAPASTLAQRNNDTWLTTKVRARLLDGSGYPPNAIKVITERGTVYLLGLVSDSEGRAAANIAGTTPGIQQVITLFEPIAP